MNRNTNTLHGKAQAHFEKQHLPEALSLYREICSRSPSDAQAWHMAGAIAGMMGKYEYARECCEKLILLRPDLHEPHLNLANVLLATGKHQEALEQYRKALHIRPNDPQTLTNLSKLHLKNGNMEDAINCLKRVTSSGPSSAEACNNLGVAYRMQGDLEAAEKNLRQALKLKPDYIEAYCNLGAVLSDGLQPKAAGNCYEAALSISPGNRFVLRNYGNLYQTLGDYKKAKQCYLQALEEDADDPDVLASLASLYERCGDFDAAFNILEPIIAGGNITSEAVLTHAKLCRNRQRHEDAIEILEKSISIPVDPNHKINACFALGDLYNDIRNYDKAFSYYREGNELDTLDATPPDFSEYLLGIQSYFNCNKPGNTESSGNSSELPVFIAGMPRTGTSLVEQILSSHPDVYGGGERSDIINLVTLLESSSVTHERYPHLLGSISSAQLSNLADEYLVKILGLSEGKSRFTDKTPLQGMHLGFISLLLPRSRVIICKRDPLDTCLSIYFHRFNAYHSYASDMTRLGVFYREYSNLIQYWTSTLDLKILTVQYENLVQNSEHEIRRIIKFCGLEWNRQCLSFHDNKRIVNTPSYDQVRKPMYPSSMNRWKHYEEYLEPLVTALSANTGQSTP